MFGQKSWWLSPPPFAMYSTEHPLLWRERTLSAMTTPVLQCEQQAGDVIFVPDGWAHAVLNQAESIGYASEFEFLNAAV